MYEISVFYQSQNHPLHFYSLSHFNERQGECPTSSLVRSCPLSWAVGKFRNSLSSVSFVRLENHSCIAKEGQICQFQFLHTSAESCRGFGCCYLKFICTVFYCEFLQQAHRCTQAWLSYIFLQVVSPRLNAYLPFAPTYAFLCTHVPNICILIHTAWAVELHY